MDAPLARQRHSYEDLLASPRGRHCELFDGELFECPVPTLPHQRTAQRLVRAFEEALRDGSRVVSSPVDVILARDTVARPDLLLVLAGHLAIVGEAGTAGVTVHGAPDLILEVLSPATVRLDRVIKMDVYARYSVPEYWLVDSAAKLIEIFRLDRHAQLYRLTETCRPGERARTPLVPGLAVEVERLFG
ncbi:MAG TPA: Uma2 family endonuclease [Thermoanaerobaculia bacterium]|jgi:Uma2 family endonuclease|nr:Uma2 family endonuclease [Thermoanaerobaculia bacterium]